MKRIAIFGGSFDPVHSGHMLIAEAALRQFSLDRIIFVPAMRSPHKPDSIYAPARHRLAMVRSVCRGKKNYDWSDIEIRRKGLSFTIDTLSYMCDEYPEANLHLLLGSDNIRSFHTWKEPRRISQLARIIVYQRWEHTVTRPMLKRWKAQLLKGPEIFISSTAVRDRCVHGRTIKHFVPSVIERYIHRHAVYARTRGER